MGVVCDLFGSKWVEVGQSGSKWVRVGQSGSEWLGAEFSIVQISPLGRNLFKSVSPVCGSGVRD